MPLDGLLIPNALPLTALSALSAPPFPTPKSRCEIELKADLPPRVGSFSPFLAPERPGTPFDEEIPVSPGRWGLTYHLSLLVYFNHLCLICFYGEKKSFGVIEPPQFLREDIAL